MIRSDIRSSQKKFQVPYWPGTIRNGLFPFQKKGQNMVSALFMVIFSFDSLNHVNSLLIPKFGFFIISLKREQNINEKQGHILKKLQELHFLSFHWERKITNVQGPYVQDLGALAFADRSLQTDGVVEPDP